VTTVGVVYSWALFRRFEINVFNYAEANDFLLAAFKDPVVFGMSMFTIIFFPAMVMLVRMYLLWRAHRSNRYTAAEWLEDATASESAKPAPPIPAPPIPADATVVIVRLIVSWGLPIFVFIVFTYSLLPPYVFANFAANDLQSSSYEPLTSVQYKATSGSNEQTTETGLRLIGTTQSFVFFYDKNDEKTNKEKPRTLIIPNAQIVEMEHSVKKP
jgi:hypothetical protein